jgi:tuberculosinol/isotuberculosinol synthase
LDLDEFRRLPTEEIARLVRAAGPQVCVFPINGTRRWFILEHGAKTGEDPLVTYLEVAGRRHIELYRMLFDHGLDTLLTPIFGPDILARGKGYERVIQIGLTWWAERPEFLEFYDQANVRVRVYGDARRCLEGTPYAGALDIFDEVTRRTAGHRSRRLFFGVCAQDATETVAEIAVRFYQEHSRPPNRQEIVEAYYGEYVAPVDLFIGMAPPAVFDMPLLATGRENLYFTVAPSPYLDRDTLRVILYDHLYARRVEDEDYSDLPAEEWQRLAGFYRRHRHQVLGVGRIGGGGRLWLPLTQTEAEGEPPDNC